MSSKHSGIFSLSLQSIEWQVKNLFQDVGGDKAIELMDKLAGIPEEERAYILDRFLAFVAKAAKPQVSAFAKVSSATNQVLKTEDQLVDEVLSFVEKQNKFSVVQGGKSPQPVIGQLIDFATAKKERAGHSKAEAN